MSPVWERDANSIIYLENDFFFFKKKKLFHFSFVQSITQSKIIVEQECFLFFSSTDHRFVSLTTLHCHKFQFNTLFYTSSNVSSS